MSDIRRLAEEARVRAAQGQLGYATFHVPALADFVLRVTDEGMRKHIEKAIGKTIRRCSADDCAGPRWPCDRCAALADAIMALLLEGAP